VKSSTCATSRPVKYGAPLPCRRCQSDYRIRHAAGCTSFEHIHGLRQRLTLFASPEDRGSFTCGSRTPGIVLAGLPHQYWNGTGNTMLLASYLVPDMTPRVLLLVTILQHGVRRAHRLLIASKRLSRLTIDRRSFSAGVGRTPLQLPLHASDWVPTSPSEDCACSPAAYRPAPRGFERFTSSGPGWKPRTCPRDGQKVPHAG